MKKVLFILGTTCSGKSDFAVKLAKMYNGEIISADSVQVYKNFDIGSAKIIQQEMDGIVHYGIDIKEPNEEFTVYNFVEGEMRHGISAGTAAAAGRNPGGLSGGQADCKGEDAHHSGVAHLRHGDRPPRAEPAGELCPGRPVVRGPGERL